MTARKVAAATFHQFTAVRFAQVRRGGRAPGVTSLIATPCMDSLVELFNKLRDVRGLVAWGGYVGITAIIFAETGLLIGFFLPGDSLIVTAGLLSATMGVMNVWLLGLLLTVASILGNTVGYHVGQAAGPRLFTREDSLLFNKKHLVRAHEFYERHGGKTIIIARFMPI